jgi:hypothetical protein
MQFPDQEIRWLSILEITYKICFLVSNLEERVLHLYVQVCVD